MHIASYTNEFTFDNSATVVYDCLTNSPLWCCDLSTTTALSWGLLHSSYVIHQGSVSYSIHFAGQSVVHPVYFRKKRCGLRNVYMWCSDLSTVIALTVVAIVTFKVMVGTIFMHLQFSRLSIYRTCTVCMCWSIS